MLALCAHVVWSNVVEPTPSMMPVPVTAVDGIVAAGATCCLPGRKLVTGGSTTGVSAVFAVVSLHLLAAHKA
jgi:hypothetical protein